VTAGTIFTVGVPEDGGRGDAPPARPQVPPELADELNALNLPRSSGAARGITLPGNAGRSFWTGAGSSRLAGVARGAIRRSRTARPGSPALPRWRRRRLPWLPHATRVKPEPSGDVLRTITFAYTSVDGAEDGRATEPIAVQGPGDFVAAVQSAPVPA
jgi:hypothetical protein